MLVVETLFVCECMCVGGVIQRFTENIHKGIIQVLRCEGKDTPNMA